MKKELEINVEAKNGLEAIKCSQIVQELNNYVSNIELEYKGYKIDAKSIMGLLSLLVRQGDSVKLSAEGQDSENAISALRNLLTK